MTRVGAGLFLVWALMAGCGDDRIAGKGAASETTNGVVLEGRVVRGDGSPAARVGVVLGRPQTDSVYDKALTDDSGAFTLIAPEPGRFLIRGEGADSSFSALVTAGATPTQRIDPLVRTASSNAKGRLVGDVRDPALLRVRLPETGLETSVGPDSTWSLKGIPAGWHLAQVVEAGVVVGEATVSTWTSTDVPVERRAICLLDDFEADEGQGRLVHLLDGSWWGRWNDTSSRYDSARTWRGTQGLATDSSAWSGRSLHVPMRTGEAIANHPELVRSAGAVLKIGGREDLDSASVWFPAARIDSVVFWAKGTGTVEFRIQARSSGARSPVGFFRKQLVLGSGWERHAIAGNEFAADSGLEWKNSRIRELGWTTGSSSVELWLDEIALVGIRPSDLLRR